MKSTLTTWRIAFRQQKSSQTLTGIQGSPAKKGRLKNVDSFKSYHRVPEMHFQVGLSSCVSQLKKRRQNTTYNSRLRICITFDWRRFLRSVFLLESHRLVEFLVAKKFSRTTLHVVFTGLKIKPEPKIRFAWILRNCPFLGNSYEVAEIWQRFLVAHYVCFKTVWLFFSGASEHSAKNAVFCGKIPWKTALQWLFLLWNAQMATKWVLVTN